MIVTKKSGVKWKTKKTMGKKGILLVCNGRSSDNDFYGSYLNASC